MLSPEKFLFNKCFIKIMLQIFLKKLYSELMRKNCVRTFLVILSCMSTDIFSQKGYAKNILCLVRWEKLCLKNLFITKVVLKNIPFKFLLKKVVYKNYVHRL